MVQCLTMRHGRCHVPHSPNQPALERRHLGNICKIETSAVGKVQKVGGGPKPLTLDTDEDSTPSDNKLSLELLHGERLREDSVHTGRAGLQM